MKTIHKVLNCNSSKIKELKPRSVDLVVTSPPYPMIEMWDQIFAEQNPLIGDALKNGNGPKAFELMNRVLDSVWKEVHRVLKYGGIACINIGDATRSISGEFSLYPSHARILSRLQKLGFCILPEILWRKQTNAPNKFMGSGMLPAGAYVTLEHEFILIARKGGKREFDFEKAKENRRQSAFFWEERNTWFSDVWMDLKGVRQNTNSKDLRKRSGAFPFELPYRLINMYSAKGDVVLDPFAGLGATLQAAMASGRNSVGCEIDTELCAEIPSAFGDIVDIAAQRIRSRVEDHADFVRNRFEQKGPFKYKNQNYGFPVITRQEIQLLFNMIESVVKIEDNVFEVKYSDDPYNEFCDDWDGYFMEAGDEKPRPKARKCAIKKDHSKQRRIFE